MQEAEGRWWWIANLGSSEIRSRAARSTSERAIHSTTPAGCQVTKLLKGQNVQNLSHFRSSQLVLKLSKQ